MSFVCVAEREQERREPGNISGAGASNKVNQGQEGFMKRSISLGAFCLLGLARLGMAYEYPLQFAPNPGFRGLVVAGYRFDQNGNVVGNCSYYTVSGGSGKGGGGGKSTSYKQTCTWDLHGNLLSIAPGAPAVPAPVATKGSAIVYAIDSNGDYTGTDRELPEKGFVNSPGSHYTWLTPSGNAVLHQIVYTMTASLKSNGDMPLNISGVQVSALNGVATLKSENCDQAPIDVGDKCSITLTYDPGNLTAPNGIATDTLRVDLTSDAGEGHDFILNFTIILPEKEN
jgi:hypothetical protein